MTGQVKVVEQLEAVQRTEKQQQAQLQAKTEKGIKKIQGMTAKLKHMKSGTGASKYAKGCQRQNTREGREKSHVILHVKTSQCCEP